MKFKKEHLRDAVLNGVVGETDHGITLIEEGQWASEGKYERAAYIFQFEGKFYRVKDSRTGSYFTDYFYESGGWRDEVECEEVEKVEVISHQWKRV